MQDACCVVALAAVMAAGCATGRAFCARRGGRAAPATGKRRSASTGRRSTTIPIGPTTRSRSSGRCSPPPAHVRRARAAVRGGRPARRGAARLSQGAGVRAVEPAVERQGRRRSSGRCAIASKRRRRGPRSSGCAQQARAPTVEPILSPTNPEPLIVNFVNTSLRDILMFIGNYTGINVTFDRDFQDRADHAEARRRVARAGARSRS